MQGSLKIGYMQHFGFYAYDGVNFLKILSPYLILKCLKHRNKISIFIAGSWFIIGKYLLLFNHDKKIIHQWIDLKERYHRDVLLNYSIMNGEKK